MSENISDIKSTILIEQKTYRINANNGDIYSTEQNLTFRGSYMRSNASTNLSAKIICRTIGTSYGGYVEYEVYKNNPGEPSILHISGDQNANCPLVRVDSNGYLKILFRGATEQVYSVAVVVIVFSL